MNELTPELIAGCAYFVYVTFKAMQQRNVAWLRYWPVMPVSYLMAFAEVLVISTISYRATTVFPPSWHSIIDLMPMMLAIGTGGGFGAIFGMFLHHKYIGEKDKR